MQKRMILTLLFSFTITNRNDILCSGTTRKFNNVSVKAASKNLGRSDFDSNQNIAALHLHLRGPNYVNYLFGDYF